MTFYDLDHVYLFHTFPLFFLIRRAPYLHQARWNTTRQRLAERLLQQK